MKSLYLYDLSDIIPGIKGVTQHKGKRIMGHINRMKGQNHMIMSIDAKTPFDKIQSV
jgi:hypothetical protein